MIKALLILTYIGFYTNSFALAAQNDELSAEKIAALLLSARATVSSNPKFIADPTTSGITAASFLESVKEKYKTNSGKPLEVSNEDGSQQVLEAIESVVKDALDGKHKDKWSSGIYPNKFIPARFAREVTVKFSNSMKGKMLLRLTTRKEFLVNKDNAADEWENKIIENNFLKGGSVAFSEKTKFQNKNVFRFITPEKFTTTCLSCHGFDAGKKLHPSGTSGEEGAFGGAISLIMYK